MKMSARVMRKCKTPEGFSAAGSYINSAEGLNAPRVDYEVNIGQTIEREVGLHGTAKPIGLPASR